jgi:hypothetical protein
MNGQVCQGSKKGKLLHLCPWLEVKENILDANAKVDLVVLEDAHVSMLDWNAILNVMGASTRTALTRIWGVFDNCF